MFSRLVHPPCTAQPPAALSAGKLQVGVTHPSSWWLHKNLRSWDGPAPAPQELPLGSVFLAGQREQQQEGSV